MKLFDPIKIRKMELKNRILMAPMLSNLGYKSQRGRSFYAARARGGVGGIVAYGIPPELFVESEAWEKPEARALFLQGLKLLTDEIHASDTKIGAQLWYGNRFPAVMRGKFDSGEWRAPSARVEGFPSHLLVPSSSHLREFDVKEIELLIQLFGKAAAKAKEVGFDFVEFHGAHSYLANQFFSPADNHRTDQYGGNLMGRMRFGIECVRAIRRAVGEEYPIFFRFPAEEARPGGITITESTEYALELERAGVDVLSVSIGTSNDRRGMDYYITPPYDRPLATYAHLSEAIKTRVKAYVGAVGRISSPGVAETIISKDRADLIMLGRQLIADPDWPCKVLNGQWDSVRPCISCCECTDLVMRGKQLRCTVNPMAGREIEFDMKPAKKSRKVFVLGGGPAGMEAATISSLRGHRVVLLERESRLGGQLLLSGMIPHKDVNLHLTKYMIGQLKNSGVEVKLCWGGDSVDIKNADPDVVILATGATPILPSIKGSKQSHVVTSFGVLSSQEETGNRVLIVGGGMVGLETAEFLATMGKQVTVFEMLDEVGRDGIPVIREAIRQRLNKVGVNMYTKTEVVEITAEGVRVNCEDETAFFEGDSVVLASGMQPNNEIKAELQKFTGRIYAIGDCAEARTIRSAIEEGFQVGYGI